MPKLKQTLMKIEYAIKDGYSRGKKWIGYDGLLNMESSALLLMVFIIFLKFYWAIIAASLVTGFKCYVDHVNGHKNEKHDLICSAFGIIIGFIIVVAIVL
jgi:hypothetical protein